MNLTSKNTIAALIIAVVVGVMLYVFLQPEKQVVVETPQVVTTQPAVVEPPVAE